ncbi:MAG: hypothetical protein HOV87_16150 [Catenulispora sp.]|nr:hypothetical protein [Catenulispora sp.]
MASVGRGGPIGLRNSGSKAATALLAVISFVCVMGGVAFVSAAPASANMGICKTSQQPYGDLTQAQATMSAEPTVDLTHATASAQGTVAARGHAYVYDWDCTGDDAGLAPYYRRYQYNSLGPNYQNRFARLGTGSYRVWFAGLGLVGGVAHVTAYGPNQSGQCKIAYWGPDNIDQAVTIYCFDANGNLVDRQFTATYTNEVASSYGFGYLWADSPTASSYTPATAYQFSTAGLPNTIVRTGTGKYKVTMTGLAKSAPNSAVLVSAYGVTQDAYGKITNGTVGCQVGTSAGTFATVNCFAGGTPTDAMFTLTYVGQGNILDAPNAPLINVTPTTALPSSYAWVDGTSATAPDPTWRFSTAGPDTWAQSYDAANVITYVSVPVYSGWGDVQVVAYGTVASYCSVTSWADRSIGVQCWSPPGKLTTTPFTVFFTGAV